MKRITITVGKQVVGKSAVLVLAILLTMMAAGRVDALDIDESQDSGIRFGRGIDISRTAAEPQTVATADLDGDGDLDVVSASQLDGAIHWYRNDGALTPQLEPLLIGQVGGATHILPADLNGDATMDLVVVGVGSSFEGSKLVWYHNNGASTPYFSRRDISDLHHRPVATSAADLDRDGDLDLLLVDRSLDQLWFYDNLGGSEPGFFGTLVADNLDGAVDVTSGDLDRDGDLDIVAAAENSDAIVWYENRGNRPPSFNAHIIRFAATPPSSSQMDYARTIDLGDINGDGWLDVAYGSDVDGEVGWYENNRAAIPAFANHLVTTEMEAVKSVAVADVDHDGDLDITAGGEGTFLFFESNGALTPGFEPQSLTPDIAGFRDVTIADLNGDGQRDLLSASEDDFRVVWYPNQKMHRSAYFSAQTRSVISVRSSSRMAHSGDLDRDGDMDVVSISNGALLWHENNGNVLPSFETYLIEDGIDGGRWVHVADLDGDGDEDVISSIPADNRVAWHENLGGNPLQFQLHVITSGASGARAALAADLDGDGDLDVFSASHGDNKIAWYENLGGTPLSFQEHVVTRNANYARSVYAADLDADGRLDLISASQYDDKINWYRNNGESPPTFTTFLIGLADGAQHVEAADVDGDGDIDVISASEYNNMVAWYENSGDPLPEFQHHPIDGAASGVHAVTAADFDGDGDVDLVAAIEFLNAIKWYENDGQDDPQFRTHLVYDRALATHGIHANDIDSDGDTDIVGISRDDGVVAWFENQGGNYAIKLTPSQILPAGSQPYELATITVDHRGRRGDADVRLNALEFSFTGPSGAAVGASIFRQALEAVYIYADNGDGRFSTDQDQQIVWLEPSLSQNGYLIAPIPAGHESAHIGVGESQAFFLVVRPSANCSVIFEPSLLVTARVALDSRYQTPLQAESVARLSNGGLPGDTDSPNYLFINEVMASNVSTLSDPEEPLEFPDWFEIYNAAPFAIELGGMYLTDDLGEPTKYRIPDGVVIAPRGHQLFIADNEVTQGPYHTSFRLSSRGESLGLFDTDQRANELIDAVTFEAQEPDSPFGRYPSGRDSWTKLATATPGQANMHVLIKTEMHFPIASTQALLASTCPSVVE